MRNIKHHSIIITGHVKEQMQQVRVKILELVKIGVEVSNGSSIVGEIMESLINNYYTLVVYPDGSKEGHETSDDWDIVRKQIIVYLSEYNKSSGNTINYIEVSFGDDTGKAEIKNYG